jgi:hypothetical protein
MSQESFKGLIEILMNEEGIMRVIQALVTHQVMIVYQRNHVDAWMPLKLINVHLMMVLMSRMVYHLVVVMMIGC